MRMRLRHIPARRGVTGRESSRRAPSTAHCTAVLLMADQAANRLPRVCMRTGRPTDEVVSMRVTPLRHFERWTFVVGTPLALMLARLIGRRSIRIVLPVVADAWLAWRKSFLRCVMLGSAGVGFLLVGAVRNVPALLVVGVLLVMLNWAARVRLRLARWVGVELVPQKGHILVSRVHPEFDREAARLFAAAVNTRR